MSEIITFGNMRSQLAMNHAKRQDSWSKMLQTNEQGIQVNAKGSLKYDDYKELTDDVVQAREFDNVGILYRSLVGAGLTRPADISKTLIDYHDMNDNTGAHVTMDASNREAGSTDYNQKVVPLPIFHKDFVIPWRQEGFSYKQSDGIQQTTFDVVETRDLTLLNGNTSIKIDGTALTGVTNATGVQTDTISNWALAATTGPTIRDEAVGLVSTLSTTSKVSAPDSCMMFVASDVYPSLERQFSTSYESGSIRKNLMTLSVIKDIQMLPGLPDGAVLIIELRPRTIDLAIASDVIAMPWQKNSQLEDGRFTVIASCTPRIKADRNGVTGIMYATK